MPTNEERIRKVKTIIVNSEVESNDEDKERARLEAEHGQVWDTTQVQVDFNIVGFAAPYVGVTRKEDGARGSLMFQHLPRFYFCFKPE